MDTPLGDKIAFRIDEAVRATGLSRSSLYVLIASGELPAIKAGGRRLILRADLHTYFEGLKSAAGRS
jgi:excisionase family DNA binding protein